MRSGRSDSADFRWRIRMRVVSALWTKNGVNVAPDICSDLRRHGS